MGGEPAHTSAWGRAFFLKMMEGRMMEFIGFRAKDMYALILEKFTRLLLTVLQN